MRSAFVSLIPVESCGTQIFGRGKTIEQWPENEDWNDGEKSHCRPPGQAPRKPQAQGSFPWPARKSPTRNARSPAILHWMVLMITPSYLGVWMKAKATAWRLRHPAINSAHLLYACLRLHDQRHWARCRNLPVTAEVVWSHLKKNPPFTEADEDFYGVRLGVSAKLALERAEAEAKQRGSPTTGTNSLMRALLSESEGPVRSLLDATRVAPSEAPADGEVG